MQEKFLGRVIRMSCEGCPFLIEKDTTDPNTGEPDFVKVCVAETCEGGEEKDERTRIS